MSQAETVEAGGRVYYARVKPGWVFGPFRTPELARRVGMLWGRTKHVVVWSTQHDDPDIEL